MRATGARAPSGRSVAVYWGAVALLCLAVSPLAPQLAHELPSCPVKSVTGLPCPTCGAGRATLALAELSPAAALAANPLATVAWTVFLGGGLAALVLAVANRPLPNLPRRLPIAVRAVAVAAIVANWLYLLRTGI